MLTKRQKDILNGIVEKYISFAEPVGSKEIDQILGLGVSPATVRLEMQKLTKMGYITQPHTSAGRIPTDKGYRFFVDGLLDKNFYEDREKKDWQGAENPLSLLREITKDISQNASGFVFGFLAKERVFWKEGLEFVFQEPEFLEPKYGIKFIETVASLEENFENLFFNIPFGLRVQIGKENPFLAQGDLSIVISRYRTPEDLVLAILGPKRMHYRKNISLINKYGR
ncbi:MAG: hypothetical protein HYW70_01305 [Candidatus Nealsonbacteria bacterium]|nr:hypothetical protein [Candidatus Nealsonbacteria bacterium]